MPIKEVQQTNKQHAVPQNIMDVEFKLIGDLTMRQFSYLLVFGGIAYVIYLTVYGFFKWPMVTFFTLFGLALAFIPIQERGMDEWVVNFFRSVYSPTQMLWKKAPVLPSAFTYESLDVVRQELITLAPTSSRRKLEEYLNSKNIVEETDRLDIPEGEYILKVRTAFADMAPIAPQMPAETSSFQSAPIASPATPSVAPTIEQPIPSQPVVETPPAGTSEIKPASGPPVIPNETSRTSAEQPVTAPKETPRPSTDIPAQKPQKQSVAPTSLRPRLRPNLKMSDTLALLPLTPDRHSGRKFTNLSPSQGRLVLPIRGEKVLRTSAEAALDVDQNEKAAKLQALLDKIKESKEYKSVQFTKTQANPVDLKVEAKTVEKEVKDEKDILTKEITKVSQELNSTDISENERVEKQHLLERLREQQKKANTDYAKLQKQILDLQKKIDDAPQAQSQDSQPKQPVYSKMQAISSEPNIITGVVYDNSRSVMQNLVLLIKNSKGEPVRALRTNSLGQFIISTPLSNGIYTVEVNSATEKNLSFDIISVEAKGEVIPPIEILGKLK